jgi:hypothetical protein
MEKENKYQKPDLSNEKLLIDIFDINTQTLTATIGK